MNYSQVLNELETLVNDTFGLWEHNRVGFQWRHYTWNPHHACACDGHGTR